MCCTVCYFKNLHYGHKLLEINDEKELKMQKISIEDSSKDYTIVTDKINKLKEKIEKEISEIDKIYYNVNKEVSDSFAEKHKILIKEENNLKEKLQNEVTKVKEKLEIFLSETSRLIKISERINKGVKSLEKEEKSIVTNLSYISKINKSQKEMKLLSHELMKNLQISFNEKETNIAFKEYFFNGIQIPKNIKIKSLGSNSFEVLWEIDEINILNIDNNKLKYIVEIREEKSNSKFIKVYEGNNKNCLIDKLLKDTNYEIRICSIYNELIGPWSQIQKVKTLFVDSIILCESQRQEEFLKIIYEWSGFNNIELLYRGSRDGTTSDIFHKKCDKKGQTICLYKNDKDFIFGGYSSISWGTEGKYISAPDCFIFTLTNMHGIEPTKFINSNTDKSVYHSSNYGPCFGNYNDINITADYLKSGPYARFPTDYKDTTGKGKSLFTGNEDNSDDTLKIKEIEVFKIF